MKKRFTLYLLLFPFLTFGQSLLEKMNLKIGMAKSEADTRIFSEQYGHTLDDEYFINLTIEQPIFKKLQLHAGLGYALSVNDYNVYINTFYFGRLSPDVHTVGTYKKHQFQPNLALTYSLLEKADFTYSIGLLWNYNFYVHKSIRNSNDNLTFSKWLLAPSLMELYPTTSLQYKRFSLELGYRILNRNYQDKAIQTFSPNGNTANQTFLAEGDTYNPTKFRLSIGYRLK